MYKGEFNLWDIKEGPIKYFTVNGKLRNSGYLAIFRVYKFIDKSFKIKEYDFLWQGMVPRVPRLRWDVTNTIKDYIQNEEVVPVLNDEQFNYRKQKILSIIRRFGV